ncbi:hypothetical protein LPJ66_010932 [Kickxella alabastrina]|uniref:Uncharacterized protein n=1 Tax=Kickxella alabastrina TaxID=61397 RepID=A0ACC1I380_9FUNG|nr:hypothetical protein LPJ66_010932 [Kickxella alabastrina]
MELDNNMPFPLPGMFMSDRITVFTNMYYPPSKSAIVALKLLDLPYIEIEVSPFRPPSWMQAHIWKSLPPNTFPCTYIPPIGSSSTSQLVAGTIPVLQYLHLVTGQLPVPQSDESCAAHNMLTFCLGAMHCYSLNLLSLCIADKVAGERYDHLRCRLWRWLQIINDVLVRSDEGNCGPFFGGANKIGVAEIVGIVYTGPLHTHGHAYGLVPPITQEYSRYYCWLQNSLANEFIRDNATSSQALSKDGLFLNDWQQAALPRSTALSGVQMQISP